MKTQIALEDVMINLAKNSGQPSVIIMDRGLMDSAGYIGWEKFNEILDRMNWTVEELRDRRYDAIVHLVTAADGAAEFYDTKRYINYETLEEAINRDQQLQKVYLGHNNVSFIGNNEPDGFNGKMDRLVNAVYASLGMPNCEKRFRKFLLKPLHETILQGMVPYN
jgi:hypothetical protein